MSGLVVCHILAAYDEREAQARTIARVAGAVGGTHHLITGDLRCATDSFASVCDTGVSLRRFGFADAHVITARLDELQPDVVHYHGGPIGALSVKRWSGAHPVVVSLYMWSKVRMRALLSVRRWRVLVRTPVLAPRTVLNTLLPAALFVSTLRRAGVCALITTDADTRDHLCGRALPVLHARGIVPPQAARTPTHERVFVFAGRAEYSRGADVLAAAVAELAARGVDVTARFCLLDTGMVSEVEGQLRLAAGAARIEVTVDGASLKEEFARATAVVLPFRYDFATMTPNMVAAEAMSSGVPVIASDVDCMRSLIRDGDNGVLVAPGDVGGLADAIERLCDHEAAAAMADRALAGIEADWERGALPAVVEWAYRVAVAPGATSANRHGGADGACCAATEGSPT